MIQVKMMGGGGGSLLPESISAGETPVYYKQAGNASFTIRKAGRYRVRYNFAMNNSSVGNVDTKAHIYRNGTIVPGSTTTCNNNRSPTISGASIDIQLNNGDRIDIKVDPNVYDFEMGSIRGTFVGILAPDLQAELDGIVK